VKPIHLSDIEETLSRVSSAPPDPVPNTCGELLWGKAEALERLGGDEDLLRDLCQIFLEESPKLLQKLREAIAAADPEAIMRAAHSIKGELGYLGAAKATQAAQELEDMGHEKNLSRATEVFTLLDQEFTGLRLTLKEFAGAVS